MKKRYFILCIALTLGLFLASCQKKVKVTFGSEGGTAVSAIETKKGSTIQAPADPTREGYIFLYWTLNGEKFDFATKINDNITLLAKWQDESVLPAMPTPNHVRVEDGVVKWDAVENAGGYLVYVDGVSHSVTTNAYALGNIESAIISVVTLPQTTDYKKSVPSEEIHYVMGPSEAEVTACMETFGLDETRVNDATMLAYVLKKYGLTIQEVQMVMNAGEEGILQVLESKKLNAYLALGLTYLDMNMRYQIINNQDGLEMDFTEDEKQGMQQLFDKVVQSGAYTSTVQSVFDDDQFMNLVAPNLLLSFSTGATTTNPILTLASQACSGMMPYQMRRNGETITFTSEMLGKTYALNLNEIVLLLNAPLTVDDYNVLYLFYQKQQSMVGQIVYEKALKALEEKDGALDAYLEQHLEGLTTFVNKGYAKSKTLFMVVPQLVGLIQQLPNVTDSTEFLGMLNQILILKNQIVDVIKSILPTEAELVVINDLLDVFPYEALFISMNPALSGMIGNISIEITKEDLATLEDVLDFIKKIDTKHYDLMTMIQYFVFGDTTKEELAMAEVGKLVQDLSVLVLGNIQMGGATLDTYLDAIIDKLNTLPIDIPSAFSLFFGFELDKTVLKELADEVVVLVRTLSKVELDETFIIAFVTNIANGGTPSTEEIMYLVEAVSPVLFDYIDAYYISTHEKYIKGALFSLTYGHLPEGVTVDQIYQTLFEHFDGLKQYARMLLQNQMIQSSGVMDGEKICLENYLTFVQNAKAVEDVKAILEMIFELQGLDVNDNDLYVFLSNQPAEQIQYALDILTKEAPTDEELMQLDELLIVLAIREYTPEIE
ncbi:MAG: InlB B-repeat-containing protein [Prevotella sp.]|nr:InlB B-repeat-containing protein [Staphylococcus sp.]MCM1350017.1 InlB B-repeat-containing protein [Prevotella sp.]